MTSDRVLNKIREFAMFQCSLPEIAAAIDVTPEKLEEMMKGDINVKMAIDHGYEFGKATVRKRQFEMSEASVDMAKWWGMQHLGQSTKGEQTTELSTADEGGITINFVTPGANES